MPVSVKVGGVWKTATNVYNKVGGVWKTATDMPVKVGGVWKTGVLIQGAYESIASATGSGTFSVTFSSIPQTYKHLQLRVFALSTGSNPDGMSLRINGVTTSTYASHYINGSGSSVSASGTANNDKIGDVAYSVGTGFSNTGGAAIIDIYDYASTTKNKTVRSFSGRDLNTNAFGGELKLTSGFLNSTSAVTSLTIINGQNFNTGTSIALYGIKG